MTTQTVIEEFPTQAEILDVPYDQSGGNCAVESLTAIVPFSRAPIEQNTSERSTPRLLTLEQEELVAKHYRLVGAVAYKFSRYLDRNLDNDDMRSDGNMGLLDAALRYDPAQDNTFATYAVHRIRGAILDGIRERSFLPRSVAQRVKKINDLETRQVSDSEICEQLQITRDKLHATRYLAQRGALTSLDAPIHTRGDKDKNIDLFDLLAAAEAGPEESLLQKVSDQLTSKALEEAVGRLKPQQTNLIREYYYNGKTLKEIGKENGLTESRMCQVHKGAVKNLLRAMNKAINKDFEPFMPAPAEPSTHRSTDSLALTEGYQNLPRPHKLTSIPFEVAAERVPKQPANKQALSFLKVLTKGHELPEEINQEDVELFAEAVLGLVHAIKAPTAKMQPGESDEIIRQFIRGKSYEEIIAQMGHVKSEGSVRVWVSETLSKVREAFGAKTLSGLFTQLVTDNSKRRAELNAIEAVLQTITSKKAGSLAVAYEVDISAANKAAKAYIKKHRGESFRLEELRKEVRALGRLSSAGYRAFKGGFSKLQTELEEELSAEGKFVEWQRSGEKRGRRYSLIVDMPSSPARARTSNSKERDSSRTTNLDDWNNYGTVWRSDGAIDEIKETEKDSPSPDLVRVYLQEIGKIDLLNVEQEVDLSKRIEAGLFAHEKLRQAAAGELEISEAFRDELTWLDADGKRAKDHLLEANLRLVVSLAKRYTNKGLPFLDLIQEGNIGLVRAVEKFDYMKGYKFSTYATWWIRQALQRALADKARTIRVPVHMVEQINKATRVQRELRQELGREPSFDEVGEILDWPADKVTEVLGYGGDTVSLETPTGEDGDSTLGDFIEDSNAIQPEQVAVFGLMQEDLDGVLSALPGRSRRVLELRFGLTDGQPRTLDEAGREVGLTRERVRQIERDTLRELRISSRTQQLRDYIK